MAEEPRLSVGIKIDNVSDYINPSQTCIIEKQPLKSQNRTGKVVINKQSRPSHFGQIKTNISNQTAKITLDDCLACNGCITSAETILIDQQSISQFLDTLNSLSAAEKLAVTVSPQSVCSLAEKLGLDQRETSRRLTALLTAEFGAICVLNAGLGYFMALEETRKEFVERFERGKGLPILSSECPGWVCYAEKTLGAKVIPFMSKVKSAQAIAGDIVKIFFSSEHKIPAGNIFHVSIMPCFDKKLEASRPQFRNNLSPEKPNRFERTVDCVLSTSEILSLIESPGKNYVNRYFNDKININPLNVAFDSVNRLFEKRINSLSSSGGYGQHLIDAFSVKKTGVAFEFERDYAKCSFDSIFGVKIVVIFAYGFKNITKIVRNFFKNGSCSKKAHFIEIMACPSGCLNGGGQIKPAARGFKEQKNLVRKLNADFESLPQLSSSDIEYLTRFNAVLSKSMKMSDWAKTDFNDYTNNKPTMQLTNDW